MKSSNHANNGAYLKSLKSKNQNENEMRKFFLAGIMMALSICLSTVFAQDEKCATMQNLEASYAKDPSLKQRTLESEQALQAWLANNSSSLGGVVVSIPVVFHIIHNGEEIGTGNNVDDELVMYQLQRLNDDFRLLNEDALTSEHPFFADQVDSEIEFCMAQRDPEGDATTGIVRHYIEGESWTIDEINELIKPGTIWNRNDYLNIWCVNLIDPDSPGVDGYATFPDETSDTTDGVVVATFAFGYGEDGEKSIVASHEMGHFFNLRHIWGDDECGDDFVADTPPAEKDNEGCPDFPYNVDGPCDPGPNGEMFMNYMDYSDASCVVMFTNGQKERMLATLATTRSSLTTSDGCLPPMNTSVQEITSASYFNTYPNPSTGSFSVESLDGQNGNVNISLYNQTGALVLHFDKVNSFPFSIDLNDMPAGIYFVKFDTASGSFSEKVVIAK